MRGLLVGPGGPAGRMILDVEQLANHHRAPFVRQDYHLIALLKLKALIVTDSYYKRLAVSYVGFICELYFEKSTIEFFNSRIIFLSAFHLSHPEDYGEAVSSIENIVKAHAGQLRIVTFENFDEDLYLAYNSDVAMAVAKGHLSSGRAHFEQSGHRENRQMRCG